MFMLGCRGIKFMAENKTSILLSDVTIEGDLIEVAVAQTRFRSNPRTAGRTARIVSALSPEPIETIKVHIMNGDMEVVDVSLRKDKLDNLNNEFGQGGRGVGLAATLTCSHGELA